MMTNFLRRKDVEKRTGLTRSTIYDLMNKNQFPKPINITAGRVAWLETELEEWQAKCIAARVS
jgi:prophage regulatory protein